MTTVTELYASQFSVARLDELNTLVVVFSSHADGSGDSIELQRALEIEEQDVDLGMDTYCIRLSTGAAHYGGIISYALSPRGLFLELTEDAAAELQVGSGIRINVDLDDRALRQLQQGLSQVLDGQSCPL